MVDVFYLGKSSFILKGKSAQLALESDLDKISKIEADIVILAAESEGVKSRIAEGQKPFLIFGPGEFEIEGINIVGVPVKSEDEKSKSTVYQFLIDDLSFAHLDQIEEKLSQKQIEAVGNVDILMVSSKNPKVAVELIAQLEPKIVLPMYEGTDGKELGEFLKQIGGESGQVEKKLSISKERLPEDTQVKLLEVSR